MKILFVIQGEGRGHLTQALSLQQKLVKDGHEVVEVLVGKSPSREIPLFFKEKMNSKISFFESPNFLPTAKNKQVNLTKTFFYNLFRLHKYVGGIRFIHQRIQTTEADVVVNFYELLTGITYLLLRPKAHMISIAHQYLFLHPDFQFPKENKASLALLRFFTRMTTIGASRILALSFRKMRELPNKRIVVVPPLLRKEVLDIKPEKGNYLHGYLLNSGFAEEVKAWHKANPQVALHFFWDKKQVSKIEKVDETLSFHALDDHSFLRYMAGAKAYATTAGFESVCEAMYLGKPILMIPTHIEQACNAYDAIQTGAGAISDCFNLDLLLKLSTETHNSNFRYWAQQADWMILREFRKDLLEEDLPVGIFHRLFINWIIRFAKNLSI